MRILTPAESRDLEAIRRTIGNATVTIEICDSNAEMWRNVLDLVLQMNDVLQEKWQKTHLAKPVGEIMSSL